MKSINKFTRVLMLTCLVACASGALADKATDVYQFASLEQQQRFQALTHQLRCPKCQDQAIADSEAEIAADMRRKVAQLIREGKTNDEIVQYFVSRYGDFVNFKPPFRRQTLVLWLGPGVVLLIGLVVLVVQVRRATQDADEDDTRSDTRDKGEKSS